MQAAVVSLLLVVGACGAPPGECNGAAPQAAVQHDSDNCRNRQSSSNCQPQSAARYRDSADGTKGRGLWSPVTAGGIVTYRTGLFGCPVYSPLWLAHSRATFYPGNYATPYDYREIFDYPWNGPRPAPLPSPIPLRPPLPAETLPEPSAAAAHAAPESTSAWPAATAAMYLRQSQPRIASKPLVESR